MGYSKESSLVYGMLITGSEFALSYFAGGNKAFSSGGKGGLLGGMTDSVLQKVDNAIARASITLAINGLDEFAEESIQSVMTQWLASVATGVDFDSPEIDEILYDGLIGMFTSYGLNITYDAFTFADSFNSRMVELSYDMARKEYELSALPYANRDVEGNTIIKDREVLTCCSQNDIIKLSDIQIGKSVGAKALNYKVLDPATGEYFYFVEGTKIQNSEVFAGRGVRKPLLTEVAEGLASQFGGPPESWQHSKGFAILDRNGESVEAEIHWFQSSTIGKVKFKVKRWIE